MKDAEERAADALQWGREWSARAVEAEARALKYEQALKPFAEFHWNNAHILPDHCFLCGDEGPTVGDLRRARAALDKPGTEVENFTNEVENQGFEVIGKVDDSWIKP